MLNNHAKVKKILKIYIFLCSLLGVKRTNINILVTLLISIFDVFSVVVLIPILLSAILQKSSFIEVSNYKVSINLLIILSLGLVIVKTFVNSILLHAQNLHIFGINNVINTKLFNEFINLSPDVSKLKIGKFQRLLNHETNQFVFGICIPFYGLIVDTSLCFLFCIVLVVISPVVATYLIFMCGGGYFVLNYLLKNKISKYGQLRVELEDRRSKISEIAQKINDEIKLYSLSRKFLSEYEKVSRDLNTVQELNHTLSSLPRYFLESIGIVSILILVLAIKQFGFDSELLIYKIGFITAAAFKAIPAAYRIQNYLLTIGYNEKVLHEIEGYIGRYKKYNDERCRLNSDALVATTEIDLVINNEHKTFNLNIPPITINPGDIVCLWGDSGSGKTTFIRLLLGLVKPVWGSVSIKFINSNPLKINYISQKQNIIDDSLQNNICLNEQIENSRFHAALSSAKLADIIIEKKLNLNSDVGNDGEFISGGQRQRVLIARGIYMGDDEIFILDEATTGLQIEMQLEIFRSIIESNPNSAIIYSTHDQELKKFANKVLFFRNGVVTF